MSAPAKEDTTRGGFVYLVGAGPGDPGLLTQRGAQVLGWADSVVYDGLVNPVLLDFAPAAAERIYAGKKHVRGREAWTQEEINRLLLDLAAAGKRVVRLKGGDPFVFGRGLEECRVLAGAGVPFEIVPGVTAATGVTAYAGIPLTARGVASTVAFATGHEAAGKPSSDVDWEALARAGTVVLFMAWRTVADCCQRLIAGGRDPATPACAVYWGTTAAQRTVTATLQGLPGAVNAAGLKPPVLVVVGEVVAMREHLAWYESRPLFGARVLVTRNIDQARLFSRAIAERGGEVVTMPVTHIAAPEESDLALVHRAIDDLASYQWVLFTSANGVHGFFAELRARGRDARALCNARIACVGPATARAAASWGVIADIVPPHGNAERLAGAIAGQNGRRNGPGRALLPRAKEGRDEGAKALFEAGFAVDVVPVYRTVATASDDPMIRHGLARLRAGQIHIIAFFAPSQVRALFALLGAEAGERVRACDIVAAIGKTTGGELTGLGARVDVVSPSPDSEVLAGEIAAYYSRCHQET